jgi:Flp pilus assembly protein TadG
VTVELAVVMLPFLLFILGVFEYGRFALARHMVVSAARNGARLATVNTDVQGVHANLSTAQVTAAVNQNLAGSSLENVQIRIYRANEAGNWVNDNWEVATYQQNIAVQIDANFRPLFPTFGMLSPTKSGSIPLAGKSVMRSEGF